MSRQPYLQSLSPSCLDVRIDQRTYFDPPRSKDAELNLKPVKLKIPRVLRIIILASIHRYDFSTSVDQQSNL